MLLVQNNPFRTYRRLILFLWVHTHSFFINHIWFRGSQIRQIFLYIALLRFRLLIFLCFLFFFFITILLKYESYSPYNLNMYYIFYFGKYYNLDLILYLIFFLCFDVCKIYSCLGISSCKCILWLILAAIFQDYPGTEFEES